MSREKILCFAFNEKPSTKGLIFYAEIDEHNKVKIKPKGLIEDCDENICIKWAEDREISEKEIDEALALFLSEHGREAFKLSD